MKKITNKALCIALILLASCLSGFSQVPVSTESKAPIQFKCIGKLKNQPLFQLSLNNDVKEEYYITIKDGDDNVLYSERILGSVILRKYALDIDEWDMNDPKFKVKFEISDGQHHQAAVFNVTKNIKVVENILIAKL